MRLHLFANLSSVVLSLFLHTNEDHADRRFKIHSFLQSNVYRCQRLARMFTPIKASKPVCLSNKPYSARCNVWVQNPIYRMHRGGLNRPFIS